MSNEEIIPAINEKEGIKVKKLEESGNIELTGFVTKELTTTVIISKEIATKIIETLSNTGSVDKKFYETDLVKGKTLEIYSFIGNEPRTCWICFPRLESSKHILESIKVDLKTFVEALQKASQ